MDRWIDRLLFITWIEFQPCDEKKIIVGEQKEGALIHKERQNKNNLND